MKCTFEIPQVSAPNHSPLRPPPRPQPEAIRLCGCREDSAESEEVKINSSFPLESVNQVITSGEPALIPRCQVTTSHTDALHAPAHVPEPSQGTEAPSWPPLCRLERFRQPPQLSSVTQSKNSKWTEINCFEISPTESVGGHFHIISWANREPLWCLKHG